MKSLDKKKTEVMKKYYKNLGIKKCLDIIFNGTMYSPSNMMNWLNKFKEDRKNGKFR